ncbi:MAG: ion transporter, partial [Flavobacteriaceae bacterium]
MIISKQFERFIYVLIIANVLAMILESHENIHIKYSGYFKIFETVSILIFSLEYLFRIYEGFKEKGFKG